MLIRRFYYSKLISGTRVGGAWLSAPQSPTWKEPLTHQLASQRSGLVTFLSCRLSVKVTVTLGCSIPARRRAARSWGGRVQVAGSGQWDPWGGAPKSTPRAGSSVCKEPASAGQWGQTAAETGSEVMRGLRLTGPGFCAWSCDWAVTSTSCQVSSLCSPGSSFLSVT